MGRKNIFEIVEETFDLREELKRIYTLYAEQALENSFDYYSIRDNVEKEYFCTWKHKHTSISLSDYENRIDFHISQCFEYENIDVLLVDESSNYVFLFLEYVANMLYLFAIRSIEHNKYKFFENIINQLKYNVENVLAKLNYELMELEKEKYIIVEKNAAATAVAEIVEPEISTAVIEYNHFLLKGDIKKKKQILSTLGNKFEPIKTIVKNQNSELAKNTSYILNNFDIRHNNKEQGKYYKEYTAKMTNEDLENWYDEVYQMLLLAFLLNDNIERTKKIQEFKKSVGEISE